MTRTEPLTTVALGPGEGEALWFAGGLFVMKATADQTGEAVSVVEMTFRRGLATPVHRHVADFVCLYVLEGEATFYVGGGGPVPAPAGSFVHIPPGESFAYRVESETARILNITTPQHERFFRAGSEPAPERTPPPVGDPRAEMDMEKIGAAAAGFGVEILGPPPN